jgi:hypothetical protein
MNAFIYALLATTPPAPFLKEFAHTSSVFSRCMQRGTSGRALNSSFYSNLAGKATAKVESCLIFLKQLKVEVFPAAMVCYSFLIQQS